MPNQSSNDKFSPNFLRNCGLIGKFSCGEWARKFKKVQAKKTRANNS